MSHYRLVARLNDGVVRMDHPTYGRQLWASGKTRGRTKKCADCKKEIPPKVLAWHPITNALNRMDRLCAHCVNAWKEVQPDGSLKGVCFECGDPATDDDYCFGCKSFICSECGKNWEILGHGHLREDHLRDQEDDLDF